MVRLPLLLKPQSRIIEGFVPEEKRVKIKRTCRDHGTEIIECEPHDSLPMCCKEARFAMFASSGEPTLRPMPGKVIVKLVNRMVRFPDYSKWAKLVHRADLNPGEMDQRRQYQPYIGTIVAFGDPLDDEDQKLLDEAKERTANGERFIFTWGNGIDYSTEEMAMLETRSGKKSFEWLMLLRVFRIKDLACSVAGGDEFGGIEDEN